MDWEIFQTAYLKASPEKKALVDSDRMSHCVQTSLQNRNGFQLNRETLVELSYHVLEAQSIDTTISNLKKMGIIDGLQFIVEVQNCLSAQATTPLPVVLPQSLAAEISAAEHDLESIKGIRTMAHDMKEAKSHPVLYPSAKEVFHQSNQSDILGPNETKQQNTAPRWDSAV